MANRLKSILFFVIWSFSFLQNENIWADIPGGDPTDADQLKAVNDVREFVLPISDETQREIQSLFDSIYLKIRLKDDPIDPPRIVLIKSSDVIAFVKPETSKNIIFWNGKFLVKAKNLDSIGAIQAHEYRHFDPDQSKRRKEVGRKATFGNEVDSEIAGIATRIVKMGVIDPITKQPEDAAFNLEAIIDAWTNFGDEYSNTHPNKLHIAAVFKSIYARERYRRRFPAITANLFNKFEKEILEADAKIKFSGSLPELKGSRGPTYEKLFDFDTVGGLIAKLEKIENLSSEPINKNFIELAVEFMSDLEFFIKIQDSQKEKLFPALQRLPKNFFQRSERIRSQLKRGGDGLFSSSSFVHLESYHLREIPRLAQIEAYFQQSWKISPSDHQAIGWPNLNEDTQPGIIPLFNEFLFAQKLPNRDSSPLFLNWILPSAANIVSDYRTSDPAKNTALDIISTVAKDMSIDEIIKQVKEKKLPLEILILLDKKKGDHAIPRESRIKILEAFPEPMFDRLHLYFCRGDSEMTLAELRRLSDGTIASLPRLFQFVIEGAPTIGSNDDITYIVDQKILDQQFSKSIDLIPLPRPPSPHLEMAYGLQLTPYQQKILDRIRVVDYFPVGIMAALGQNHLKNNTEYDQLKELLENLFELFKIRSRTFNKERPGVFQENFPLSSEAINKLLAIDPLYIFAELELRNPPAVSDKEKEKYSNFVGNIEESDWTSALSKASLSKILSIFLLDNLKSDVASREGFAAALIHRCATLISEGIASTEDALLMLEGVGRIFPAYSVAFNSLLKIIQDKISRTEDISTSLNFAQALFPFQFESHSDYLNTVNGIVAAAARKQVPRVNAAHRSDQLSKFLNETRNRFKDRDPLLLHNILSHIAEIVEATPEEKGLFGIEKKEYEKAALNGLTHVNAILSCYQALDPDKKWELLQWIRGKSSELAPSIRRNIAKTLREQNIVVSVERIEAYLRARFEGMSSLVKAAFFQIALDGEKGLLHDPYWRQKIEDETLINLEPNIRKVVVQLLTAARATLPSVLQDLVLCIAYAESGKIGTPEEALRIVLSRMGALVKKFGQNLAFDPNLPEKFRKELEQLWDEVDRPDWWHASDLLERQYGNIGQIGFRMVAIRNSGTTEIALELEGPNQERFITSVQHEALDVSVETDGSDLTRFTNYLATNYGSDDYGFLPLIVDDSIRTVVYERDKNHKRRMTPLMTEAYHEAAKQLGGSILTDGAFELRGWTFKSSPFISIDIPGGNTLLLQRVAPGMPLKNLQERDPEQYAKLNKIILSLENRAQNLRTRKKQVVDKDRMPGQFFVDPESKIITILDHGQAIEIDAEVIRLRDDFMGASLSANEKNLEVILRKLKFDIPPDFSNKFKTGLQNIKSGLRPLQALHIIRSNGLVTAENESTFFQLVHLVRAKSRLALWEKTTSSRVVRNELIRHGFKNHRLLGPIKRACDRAIVELGKVAEHEKPDVYAEAK